MPLPTAARSLFIGSTPLNLLSVWFVRLIGFCSLAGKSRSATIVAAYLMQRFTIGVEDALARINAVRSIDPNMGFREQLQVFLDCNFDANTTKAAYRQWRLRQRSKLQKGTSPQHVLINVNDRYHREIWEAGVG